MFSAISPVASERRELQKQHAKELEVVLLKRLYHLLLCVFRIETCVKDRMLSTCDDGSG